MRAVTVLRQCNACATVKHQATSEAQVATVPCEVTFMLSIPGIFRNQQEEGTGAQSAFIRLEGMAVESLLANLKILS